ncbi:MAG: hypothetical protein KatS3mg030_220 [Saprospiraceae bacterium]|nr:MAG: hypothetical protein KatS3mg030_220 [Saprospiraceae bacterium]
MNAERLLVISSLVFLFAVCACSSDEGVRERATQAAQEQAAKGNPEVAPSAANTLPVAGTIMLQVQGGEVEKGQEVCLPLTARQFHQVVSMQYTLEWDPSVLAFKGIRNMRLPGLSKDNFGTHLTSQGKLTHAWYDLNVQGIDLPDGATLFELCFEAVGEPGAQTTFRFQRQSDTHRSVQCPKCAAGSGTSPLDRQNPSLIVTLPGRPNHFEPARFWHRAQ